MTDRVNAQPSGGDGAMGERQEMIARCREMVADYHAAVAIPREEFPGDRNMYLLNLEGVIARFAPALCNELDAVQARADAAERVVAVATQAVEMYDALTYEAWAWQMDDHIEALRDAVIAYAAIHPDDGGDDV